jgi:hypothetical protein
MLAIAESFRDVRNQSFHTGLSASEGDEFLGRQAVAFLDMTIEALGNWYRQSAPGTPALDPEEVIRRLATRHSAVLLHLQSGGVSSDLNYGLITSPISTGMDR